MRYLILSDIHANVEALDAVLRHVRRKHIDRYVLLGDVVGYGADPNLVVERLRALKNLVAVRGNHDKVCTGLEDGSNFNALALQSAHWTHERLTADHRRWLTRLPEGPRVVDKIFAISHGTPVDEDAYLFGEIEAYNVFSQTEFPVCFFGHSHLPVIFSIDETGAVFPHVARGPAFRMRLKPNLRYLINPGSVGQPRDGNARASFAHYDSERRALTIHRVKYVVQRTQQKIRDAGLPRPLADRLSIGR